MAKGSEQVGVSKLIELPKVAVEATAETIGTVWAVVSHAKPGDEPLLTDDVERTCALQEEEEPAATATATTE